MIYFSNKIQFLDSWGTATLIYILIAFLSFIPVILAMIKKIKLHPDGHGYDNCDFFSETQKKRLIDHYSRIEGTLSYWKNRAQKYVRYYRYCLIWNTFIVILIPIIS